MSPVTGPGLNSCEFPPQFFDEPNRSEHAILTLFQIDSFCTDSSYCHVGRNWKLKWKFFGSSLSISYEVTSRIWKCHENSTKIYKHFNKSMLFHTQPINSFMIVMSHSLQSPHPFWGTQPIQPQCTFEKGINLLSHSIGPQLKTKIDRKQNIFFWRNIPETR